MTFIYTVILGWALVMPVYYLSQKLGIKLTNFRLWLLVFCGTLLSNYLMSRVL
ncbi:hypothetical protein M728_001853 [Ensifer sp. WSM1721]